MTNNPKHVLVIGAGFGGIEVCKQLAEVNARIALVDRHNYHLFQPLLYQVASAALSPADIAYPIRSIFREQENVQVYLEEATSIDLKHRTVHFTDESAEYDYLVIATGATHSYFGNNAWAQHAPGLKTVDDATEIRKRILLAFEEAEHATDEDTRRSLLTFIVVGGGPTGVELAGALKEIAAETIPYDFRNVDTKTARIILVHAGERVLPSFDPRLSAAALASLESAGIEVRLQSRVSLVDELGVKIGEDRIFAHSVFWAAGVQASPIGRTLGVPVDGSGRVIVEADLSIAGYPEVFVIGDLAAMTDRRTNTPVPGVAQGAVQSGRFVGQIIRREILKQGKCTRPEFHLKDKGNMATIGKAKAVAQVGKLRFTGLFAWLLWSIVHVMFLVGFRNRVSVVISWVWNYLLSARGARLITGKVVYSLKLFGKSNSSLLDKKQ